MTLYNRLIKKTLRENVIPFNGDRSKLSWRKKILREFGEWAPIEGSGTTNSTSQTFGYYVDGDLQTNFETGEPITSTVSGLGGIESVPTTTTIDYGFGDVSTVDAPTYNQLAMQGYAKPLGFNVNRRTDFQDVNPYLDASQEFAQRVGADYMMNARVQQTIRQEVETDLTKIAAKFDSSLIENMGQNIKLAVEAIMNGQQPPLVVPPDPPFTGMSYEQMVDEQNKVNDKYNDLLAPLYKELNSYAGQLAPVGLVAKINALVEKQGQETNALYEKNLKDNQEYGDLLAKRADEWGKFVNAIEDYRKGFNFKSPSQEVAQVAGPVDSILDKVADTMDRKSAKRVFDYYNDVFLKNLSSNPRGSSPSNPLDITKMMDKREMSVLQTMVDGAMSDIDMVGDLSRETAMNMNYMNVNDALGNTRNIIGQLDNSKGDGFYVQPDGSVILKKSYDFDMEAGDNDFASPGVGGIGAAVYASFKGTRGHLSKKPVGASLSRKTAMGGETPTMHLHIVFKPTKKRKKKQNESTVWDRTKKRLNECK